MVGGVSAARRRSEAVHRTGRCGRVVGIVGDGDGADPGAVPGPVASVRGAAAPARRAHGPLHQGEPGRAVQAELPVQAHMTDLLETESNIVLSGRFSC